MPTIGHRSTVTILPQSRSFARVCRTWNDSWQYVPYLTPIKCTDAAAPEVGEADLTYEIGSIKREDATSFATYEPLSITDWFVQILIQYPGYRPVPVWHGVITETQLTMDRTGSLSGTQAFRAYGLGHVLDRKIITQARIENPDGDPKVIEWVPRVNERNKIGKTLRGNRSTEVGPDGCYLYAHNGDNWTNLDYAEYTLSYLDDGIDWRLSGDTDSLDHLLGYYDVDRKSAWDILNTLITRKNGLGFYLRYDGESATVYVEIFTLTDRTITMGDQQLTANPNRTYFTMPTDFPAEHELADIPFRVTSAGQYDQINIQGERILTVGTLSVEDENLFDYWPVDLGTAYRTAAGSDPDVNSKFRGTDKFKQVFSQFVIDTGWDGTTLSAIDATPHPMMVATKNDGTLDTQNAGSFWAAGLKFERQLPFKLGVDYSTDPPTDNNDDDAQAEFVPLKAFITDTDDGDKHEADNRWHYLDRLNSDYPGDGIKAIHYRPLDIAAGIETTQSPRHYLALNDASYTGAAADNDRPEFAWENIAVTTAIRHDLRPTIRVRFIDEGASSAERVLNILVPGVELWYCTPGTMIDIDGEGDAVVIHANNCYLRDDTQKLWAFAAFAIAWYSVQRQAIQIPIKRMGLFVPLGTYITGISNVAYWLPVNTCVTGRQIDFVSRTTTIETGYNASDMITPMMSDIGAVGKKVKAG